MRKDIVPAFTIVEAVVGMAVTAIVLAIIFVIFSITSERLYDFRKQNEYTADLNRMTYSINRSIFESEKMTVSDSAIIFESYNSDLVKFIIHENYFVRQKDEFVDTFNIAVQKIIFDTLQGKLKKIKYQRIIWMINRDEKELRLSFYKKIFPDNALKDAIKK